MSFPEIVNENREHLVFSATVGADMRDAVEKLFFFNSRQSLLIDRIRETVDETGEPEIVEVGGRLWINVVGGAMQCLFACDATQTPVGVVVYYRPDPEVLRVAHLAVAAEYSMGGNIPGGLGLGLLEKIREIAHAIKGVKRIQLPYRNNAFLRLRGSLVR